MNEVDQYISKFPIKTQEILNLLRSIIIAEAPNASENIAYGMPAYKFNKKPLVYFAAYKNHIGFYATPTGHEQFFSEFSKYKQGKGSVQFPLNQPIPYELIKRVIAYRVLENLSR